MLFNCLQYHAKAIKCYCRYFDYNNNYNTDSALNTLFSEIENAILQLYEAFDEEFMKKDSKMHNSTLTFSVYKSYDSDHLIFLR